mmetsp:Transcript_55741/g.84366  ORF Transcript_55741/g.84366 Transcript_55741/m.84366 type:complete len:102 (-) Transcript_55741:14-319(-)
MRPRGTISYKVSSEQEKKLLLLLLSKNGNDSSIRCQGDLKEDAKHYMSSRRSLRTASPDFQLIDQHIIAMYCRTTAYCQPAPAKRMKGWGCPMIRSLYRYL